MELNGWVFLISNIVLLIVPNEPAIHIVCEFDELIIATVFIDSFWRVDETR